MKKQAVTKKLLALAAGLLLTVILCLPVFAASANVETVLGQLATLQGSHISPEWDPDIRANEALVQQLLDSYNACTPAEKAEFTAQQNDDLKAYFKALYRVQGKSEADVDALFETPPASSTPPPAPSESAIPAPDESVSLPGQVVSASQADPDVSASAQSESSGMPVVSTPPVNNDGGGWGFVSLFGNRALGTGLLLVLLALVVILLIRFIIALRRAGRAPREDETENFRARELFGDGYDDNIPSELKGAVDTSPPPLADEEEEKPRRVAPVFATPSWLKSKKKAPADDIASQEDDEIWGGVSTASAASAKPSARAENEPLITGPVTVIPASKEADDEEYFSFDPEPEDEITPKQAPEAKPGAAPEPKPPAEPAPPPAGSNPDKTNPITMRSFSGQQRTGRPGKMPFKQGDPGDLDAIDE